MTLDDVLSRIDDDLPQAMERLSAVLRMPSISTDPAYEEACDKAADWLVADLASIGIAAEKRETPGHPMVVGHVGEARDDVPHFLFYGGSCIPASKAWGWRTTFQRHCGGVTNHATACP